MKQKQYDDLKNTILKCNKCSIRDRNFYPVLGEGNVYSEIVFIGCSPGKLEDAEGKPFCGDTGKILDWFLTLAGLKRKDVFVTNLCLCYSETLDCSQKIVNCRKYLLDTLNIILPKFVVVCGTQAMQEFTGIDSLQKARGKVWVHKLGFDVLCITSPSSAVTGGNLNKLRSLTLLREDAEILKNCLVERMFINKEDYE